MCYDVSKLLKKMEKLEKRYGGISADRDILEGPAQVSAFANPSLPTLTPQADHTLVANRWGFVPRFAKNAKDAQTWLRRSYNCRADTLLEKVKNNQNSMFKPVLGSPVVILIGGFYEWHTTADGTKVPYHIKMKDEEAIPVAGLMGTWNDPAEPERKYQGVTLCTTSANGLLAKIHNKPTNSPDFRMPAILLPEEISGWLDTDLQATERLQLIRSYPTEEMEAYSVINFKKKANRDVPDEQLLLPFDNDLPEAPLKLDGADFA